MTDVEQWDPSLDALTNEHREILTHASLQLKKGGLGLTAMQQEKLRSVMKLSSPLWEKFVETADVETIVEWIKVLALCEETYSGFECGSKSPVIPLVRVLRRRSAYPTSLTLWIREHSKNRFLPHGSLLDRL